MAEQARVMAKLSPVEHMLIGAAAGTAEVTLLQPIIFVKYAMQEGRALPRNPMTFYRGYYCNVVTFAPITGSQFGATRFAAGILQKHLGRDLSQIDTIACAAFGGAASSLVATPSELVQIQQQRSGASFRGAVAQVVERHGALTLYRGFTSMLVRESIYTAAYLGLMPALKTVLDTHPSMDGLPSQAPLLISGVTAGVVGATFSHPADTIKTRMQAFLEVDKKPQYRTVRSTLSTLLAEGGPGALMAGIASRCTRQIAAVFILNAAKNEIGPRLVDLKEKK